MYAKLALSAFLASRIAAQAVAPSDSHLVPNNDVYNDMPLYANYDNTIPDANELHILFPCMRMAPTTNPASIHF